jgi:hypothetical protein
MLLRKIPFENKKGLKAKHKDKRMGNFFVPL